MKAVSSIKLKDGVAMNKYTCTIKILLSNKRTEEHIITVDAVNRADAKVEAFKHYMSLADDISGRLSNRQDPPVFLGSEVELVPKETEQEAI